MALEIAKGSFTAKTTTGAQSIVDTRVPNAKAVIFWGTRQTADGYTTGFSPFFGVATGSTSEWCMSTFSDEAAATMNCGRLCRNDACIAILATGTPTVDALADFTSFDAGGGFTLNWSDAAPSAWVIHYLLLGGSDITNVATGSWASGTAAGSQVATSTLGFQPDFVLAGYPNSAVNTLTVNDVMNICLASAPSEVACISWRDRDAALTAEVTTAQRTDLFLQTLHTTSDITAGAATLTSFDAGGFTVNWSSAPVLNQPIFYLAMKGGRYKVFNETQKTSTGTKAKTGIGFTPKGLFLAGWNKVASASVDITNDIQQSIGGSAGATREEGHVWVSQDADALTSNNDMRTERTKAFGHATRDATTNAQADVSSFDPDGFTLDWTTADATAREFIGVAFGDAGLTLLLSAPARTTFSGRAQAGANSAVMTSPPARGTYNGRTHAMLSSILHASAGESTFSGNTHAAASNLALMGAVGRSTFAGAAHTLLDALSLVTVGLVTFGGKLVTLLTDSMLGGGNDFLYWRRRRRFEE